MKRKFCIAPMMKKTDKHFRFLSRLLSENAYLYTEMIHSNAILKGDKNKLLSFSEIEHPVGLQLGGSDPETLAQAAKIGEDFGYDAADCELKESHTKMECRLARGVGADLNWVLTVDGQVGSIFWG